MPDKTLSRFGRAVQAALAEYGYRRVTAAAATTTRTFETSDRLDQPIGSRAYDRTLPDYKAKKLNEYLWNAYKKNPIIWGAVELVVRATVGKQAGIQHNKLESENATEKAAAEKIQLLLEKWWKSPENDWPNLAECVQRDMILFGELVPIMMTSSLTGDVEVGFIDVNSIKEIVRDRMNTRRVTGIKVVLEGGKERVLELVKKYEGGARPPQADEKVPDWFAPWERVAAPKLVGRLLGEVFYWSSSRTLSSLRGQGDFAQVIDPATDAVRIVKGITDRISLNNRVWSEITFPDNWSQEQINAAMTLGDPKYINPPRLDDEKDDVRVFGHNKTIEWLIKSPNIAAAESVEVFKMSLALFSSGSNIPLHWMGWADELTYASAKDISNLPITYLNDRQGALRKNLKAVTDFQIDQWRIFTSELDGIPDELIYDYDFILPAIDSRTIEQITSVMKARVDTLLAAKMSGGIDEARTTQGIESALKDGGVD